MVLSHSSREHPFLSICCSCRVRSLASACKHRNPRRYCVLEQIMFPDQTIREYETCQWFGNENRAVPPCWSSRRLPVFRASISQQPSGKAPIRRFRMTSLDPETEKNWPRTSGTSSSRVCHLSDRAITSRMRSTSSPVGCSSWISSRPLRLMSDTFVPPRPTARVP